MYDNAGNLDSGFGIAGVATVNGFGGSLLAFQPDGGIVLVKVGPPYACSPTAESIPHSGRTALHPSTMARTDTQGLPCNLMERLSC